MANIQHLYRLVSNYQILDFSLNVYPALMNIYSYSSVVLKIIYYPSSSLIYDSPISRNVSLMIIVPGLTYSPISDSLAFSSSYKISLSDKQLKLQFPYMRLYYLSNGISVMLQIYFSPISAFLFRLSSLLFVNYGSKFFQTLSRLAMSLRSIT